MVGKKDIDIGKLSKEELECVLKKCIDLEKEVKSLRNNYERYNLVLQGANDGIWDWDVKNDVYSVSFKDKDIFDYSMDRPSFSIEVWKNTLHPDDREEAVKIFEEFLASGQKNYENIYRLQTRNGKYRWILSKGVAQFDDNGKIVRVAGSHTDITQTMELEKKLFSLAYYDKLTKLPNMEKIKEDFRKLMETKVEKRNIAFLYMDIDDLGYINNTLGFDTGNALLENFADFLRARFGKENCIARINADNFLVVLKYFEDLKSLKNILRRFVRDIKNEKLLEGQAVSVTISIGVSIYKEHGFDFYDLLRCSDTALYLAKKSGKDQFKIYDSKMGEYVYNTNKMINKIHMGFKNNEFRVFYQPIISLTTGLMVGLEALIRWVHPNKEPIDLAEFITTAESSGQIVRLESWVIEEVFMQTKNWVELGDLPLFVAINLSAKGMIEKDLPAFLDGMLKKYNVKPGKIEFEVTETALLYNLENSMSILNKLKSRGFRISLDDFGTGYSSLNYLKILPVNKVKLAQNFIENIERNYKDQLLVKSIIELSHGMGLEVVGEGVEYPSQNELLSTFGCDYIQGYYYGRPQPVDQINEWIRENYIKKINQNKK